VRTHLNSTANKNAGSKTSIFLLTTTLYSAKTVPWSTVLLEVLIVAQLERNFPDFMGLKVR
jgi:hypothetical protein